MATYKAVPFKKSSSIASSDSGISLVSSSEENAYEHNLIRRHLRSLTKETSSSYQRRLIIINCLVWVQITLATMVGSFIFMNPIFSCKGVPTPESKACRHPSRCSVTNKFTATYSHGLYCEGAESRVLIQSLFPIGCLLGMFLLPFLADKFGRRPSFLLGLGIEILGVCALLGGLLGGNLLGVYIGQVLIGFFAAGCSIITFVISSQVCLGHLRKSSVMVYNAVWGLTLMSFYLIYEYLPNWKDYLLYLLLLPSLGIFAYAYHTLMETPDYLLIILKSQEAYVKMMKRMAVINRAKSHRYQRVFGKQGKQNHFKPSSKPIFKQNIASKSSLQAIWQDSSNIKTIACLALGIVGYNIFYFTMQGSMERSGSSYGVTMLVAGAHEFLGFLASGIVVAKMKRTTGLMVANALTAVAGLCFLLPFVQSHPFAQTLIISFTTLTTVFSYSLSSILANQSFASTVKSTAMGLTIGLSQVGRIIVPLLIGLASDLGLHPLAIASVLLLALGILPILFVKETLELDEESQADEDEIAEAKEEQEEEEGHQLFKGRGFLRSASQGAPQGGTEKIIRRKEHDL